MVQPGGMNREPDHPTGRSSYRPTFAPKLNLVALFFEAHAS